MTDVYSEPQPSLILDKDGNPFMHASLGQQYAEALARSARDTLSNLREAASSGWTDEQYRRWVQTGEAPGGEA